MDKPLKNEVEKWVTSRVADRDFFCRFFGKPLATSEHNKSHTSSDEPFISWDRIEKRRSCLFSSISFFPNKFTFGDSQFETHFDFLLLLILPICVN